MSKNEMSVRQPRLIPTHKYESEVDQSLMTYQTTSNWVGNSSGNYGNRVTSLSTRETRGQRLRDYFTLVSDGKLIPHTGFVQHSCVGKAWGSQDRLETWTDGKWRRAKIQNFVASVANHIESPFMGEADKVLPYYYIGAAEALDYADESVLPGLITEAQSKAYSSGHDTLTFLAELHKLKAMFASRAQKLLTLPKPIASAKSKPGDWLEWRYGWRTALFDLKSLSDAIVDINDNRKRISQRSGFSQTSTHVISDVETASEINSYTYTTTTEVEVSYRGSVVADFSPPRFQINPVVTAWELLPYSFIIDWFLGIGVWLNSLSFMTLSKGEVSSGGFQVHLKRSLDRRVLSWNTIAGATFSGTRELFYEVDSVTQKRIPMSASNLPSIRLKIDEFKIIDLIAILYQRLR